MKYNILGIGIALSLSGIHAARVIAAPPLTTGNRALAASSTAHADRVCLATRPFYWEIGDQHSVLASGSEGTGAPAATAALPISTSSQWPFAAYVVQARGGNLTPADVQGLTMHSGYTNLQSERCVQRAPATAPHPLTVGSCFGAAHLVGGNNSDWRADHVNRFYFNGGHLQQLAAIDPHLTGLNAVALTSSIDAMLMPGNLLAYTSPQLDSGIHASASAYGAFLRRILDGQLQIHDLLGSHAVCTNPARCAQAQNTPLPLTENPHYSLGHWVEDDPRTGDGAFSDPGLLGFYPWIDASRTYYGVLARNSSAPGAYVVSIQCGRLIRKAWMNGKAQ